MLVMLLADEMNVEHDDIPCTPPAFPKVIVWVRKQYLRLPNNDQRVMVGGYIVVRGIALARTATLYFYFQFFFSFRFRDKIRTASRCEMISYVATKQRVFYNLDFFFRFAFATYSASMKIIPYTLQQRQYFRL